MAPVGPLDLGEIRPQIHRGFPSTSCLCGSKPAHDHPEYSNEWAGKDCTAESCLEEQLTSRPALYALIIHPLMGSVCRERHTLAGGFVRGGI